MPEEKCSCGLAAAAAFKTFERLRENLREKPDLWFVIDVIRDDLNGFMLNYMERDCNINLTEEKALLEGALKDAMDRKWDDVEEKARKADFQAWNKLLKCVEREPKEGNPCRG